MENSFEAKMERLHRADQRFIYGYKRFEEAIRQHRESIFSGSLEDHLLSVKRKPISEISERQQISSVLSYHDWVCTSKQLLAGSAYVTLPQVLVSYEDVFHYSKMRVEELGQRTWSQTKLCRAINRMLQFIEAESEVDEEMKGKISSMRKNTNALIAAAQRDVEKFIKERPSLNELREKGEMLSLPDLAKICQLQTSRVELLLKNRKRTKQTEEVMGAILPKEIARLSVISSLLKLPLRKGEFERLRIDMATRRWRLKLSAADRKSGQSIDKTFSRRDMNMFRLLWQTTELHEDDDDPTVTKTWQPFKRINAAKLLRDTTLDIAGVPVTISSLRTAAESYAAQYGSEDVQSALNFAEGHTNRVANEYYRRHGSAAKMAPWESHIERLLNNQDSPDDDNAHFESRLDEKIEKRMKRSQERWKNTINQKIHDLNVAEKKKQLRKMVKILHWSVEEDAELRSLTRYHGEGYWKEILEDSVLIKKRYETVPSAKACRGISTRWKRVKSQAKAIHRRKRRKSLKRSKNTVEEEHSKTSSRSRSRTVAMNYDTDTDIEDTETTYHRRKRRKASQPSENTNDKAEHSYTSSLSAAIDYHTDSDFEEVVAPSAAAGEKGEATPTPSRERRRAALKIDLSDVPLQPLICKSASSVKEGTSKYTNVYFDKNKNKWRVLITIDSKKHHVGWYENEEEAAADYARAVFKYKGNDKARRRKSSGFVIDLSNVPQQPPIPNTRKGPTKYKGAYFDNTKSRWIATILIDGKQRYIGSYENEEEAASDYARAVFKYKGSFRIEGRGGQRRALETNISRLPRTRSCNAAISTSAGSNDTYEVEEIVGYRRNNGEAEYLIKWVGYSKEESSWEPEANLNEGSLAEATAYREAIEVR